MVKYTYTHTRSGSLIVEDMRQPLLEEVCSYIMFAKQNKAAFTIELC